MIVVNGVFGSGKSHLLAAVCVLLARLFQYVRKKNGSGRSDKHSDLRCMLSANTNVAVDRVLSQLVKLESYDDRASDAYVPRIARVGCAQKIDPRLRKNIALMHETAAQAEKELLQLAQTDRLY